MRHPSASCAFFLAVFDNNAIDPKVIKQAGLHQE
jgi:hypothetical protein